jgi:hypothetical protein
MKCVHQIGRLLVIATAAACQPQGGAAVCPWAFYSDAQPNPSIAPSSLCVFSICNNKAFGIVPLQVVFSYNPSPTNPPVLRGLSFHAPGGRSLAVVGSTGSGKSTLLRCGDGSFLFSLEALCAVCSQSWAAHNDGQLFLTEAFC